MMTDLEKMKVALEVVARQRDEALNALVSANVEIVDLRKRLEDATNDKAAQSDEERS